MKVFLFFIVLLLFQCIGAQETENQQGTEGIYIHKFSSAHIGWEFVLHIKSKNKYTEKIKISSAINGKLKKESHKVIGEWILNTGKIILTPTRCRGDKSYCIDSALIVQENQLKIINGTGIYHKELNRFTK